MAVTKMRTWRCHAIGACIYFATKEVVSIFFHSGHWGGAAGAAERRRGQWKEMRAGLHFKLHMSTTHKGHWRIRNPNLMTSLPIRFYEYHGELPFNTVKHQGRFWGTRSRPNLTACWDPLLIWGKRGCHVVIGRRLRESGESQLPISLLPFLNRQQVRVTSGGRSALPFTNPSGPHQHTLQQCNQLVPFRKRYGSAILVISPLTCPS
jgi:hypothetical protein